MFRHRHATGRYHERRNSGDIERPHRSATGAAEIGDDGKGRIILTAASLNAKAIWRTVGAALPPAGQVDEESSRAVDVRRPPDDPFGEGADIAGHVNAFGPHHRRQAPRKLRINRLPQGVKADSGWNCTPAMG